MSVEFETVDTHKEKENIAQEKNTASTSGVTVKNSGNNETPKKYISGWYTGWSVYSGILPYPRTCQRCQKKFNTKFFWIHLNF